MSGRRPGQLGLLHPDHISPFLDSRQPAVVAKRVKVERLIRRSRDATTLRRAAKTATPKRRGREPPRVGRTRISASTGTSTGRGRGRPNRSCGAGGTRPAVPRRAGEAPAFAAAFRPRERPAATRGALGTGLVRSGSWVPPFRGFGPPLRLPCERSIQGAGGSHWVFGKPGQRQGVCVVGG